MRLRAWIITAVITMTALVASAIWAFPTVASASPSGGIRAADLSTFQPGNIISDQVFFDSGSMSEGDIQSFLNSKVSSCRAGYTCLKDKTDNSRSMGADAMCNAYQGAANEPAARIIYKVAQACGINPQVLIVTLQKEEGLVTDTWPTAGQYQMAMGYACPDTAACDSAYFGLFNQIYSAAWQFKRYANPAGTSNYFTWYAPGHTWNILFNPDRSRCGSSPVYIQNQATADLYYYTPYQPNANALAAGYGQSSDGCASYGNRNFFNYFTDWFGSTTVQVEQSPKGGFNLVLDRGVFTVQGWALDPDAPTTALTVSLTVDGVANWNSFTASASRPDVGAAYPGYGDSHGMNATFQIQGGDHTVCVTARNVGAGADTSFGCTSISVVTASPQGGTTITAVPGGVHVTGWTLDTDTTDPIAVHIYVDNVGTAYTANASRPDVGVVFPGFGDNHGIDVSIPLAVGSHQVCAYGINVGLGFNTLLGCSTVDVPSGSPFGAFESLVAVPGGVRATGWAVDPNTSSPIAVHLYRGTTGTAVTASNQRDDIAAAYPESGANHGFDAVISAPPGSTQICAYGINDGWGSNTLIGCRSTTVMSGTPFGGMDASFDAATSKVVVHGWAIDPDTADPITVHVYVDGVGTPTTANAVRADVGAVYPGYGSLHGIDASFDAGSGRHTVCAYGINTGSGSGNTLLGCSVVNVPDRSPFGGTDSTVDGLGVILRGWAIDPDTTDPIDVAVYVDGVGTTITTADASRPDVAGVYPAYGALHGIQTRIALASGRHQICSYGLNVELGGNALLACQTVTIK